jgi:membrane protease YdiL (CAAX protease family)
VAFLLLVIVAEVAIAYVIGTLVGMERVGTQSTMLLQVTLQLVAAVVATAIMLRSIDVRPWRDVGMDRRAVRPRVLLEGWLLGGVAIGLACGALLALGWLRIVPGPDGSSLSAAFSLTAFLIVAALGEELISRGYLLTTLRDGLGAAAAVGVTSVLFGAAHLRNAGVTVQSFCIVTLAGVFLGAIRLALRSVYASSAAHVAWNWVLAVAVSCVGERHPLRRARLSHRRTGARLARPAASGGRKAGSLRRSACSACWPISIARGLDAARSRRHVSEHIAVVGAGQMGNGIAHVFAQHGFSVTMIDVAEGALGRGRTTIEKNLDRQISKGTVPAEDRAAILGRVATSTSLHSVRGAALVVEAATENRELKFQIFTDSIGSADPGACWRRTPARSRSPRSPAARRARPRDRDALHESRAADAARRGHPRPRDGRTRRRSACSTWSRAWRRRRSR